MKGRWLSSIQVERTESRAALGPSYWKLWAASITSNLGDGVTMAALPLLAVTLTSDARLIGGVAFAFALPWLLFALVAGALVDRLDRRRVMWVVDGVRAALVAVLAVTVATDTASIPLLYAVAFALGTAETLFDNAAQALLPAVVEPEALELANGRQYAGEVVANSFAGPPLGAFLFSVAAAAPFWLDSATFAIAAAFIFSIRTLRPNAPPAPASSARRSLRADIAEGVRWLRGHRLLRTLALLLGTLNFASNLVWGTFVLFAIDELGLSEQGYGVLLAATAVGAVLGGLAAARIVAWLGQARALTVAVGWMAVSSLLVGLASEPFSVAALLAVNGVAVVVWNVITVSLRQAIVPAHLLGRVNSVYRTIGWGSIPLGALAGGFLARATNLRVPWFAAAGCALVALVVAITRLNQGAMVEVRAGAGSS